MNSNLQTNQPDQPPSPQTITNLSNKDLYHLCKLYGQNSRKWQRKFAFLLPEVAKRSLHRKYHCQSIYQFAAKIGGLSHEVTHRILNLHYKLKDFPNFWNQFIKYGWSKLEIISSVLSPDNQEFWFTKLQIMPKAVLAQYTKVYRQNSNQLNTIQSTPCLFDSTPRAQFDTASNIFPAKNSSRQPEITLQKPNSAGNLNFGEAITENNFNFFSSTQPATNDHIAHQIDHSTSEISQTFSKLKFSVDPETEFKLRKFQQDLSKEKRQSITMGESLKYLFEKIENLEKEIAEFKQAKKKINSAKNEIAPKKITQDVIPKNTSSAKTTEDSAKVPKCSENEVDGTFTEPSIEKTSTTTPNHHQPSRYIPQKIKKLIIKQTAGRCSMPGCNQPIEEFHHINRFALNKTQENLTGLCKIHHQMIHCQAINNENQSVENWQISFENKSKDQDHLKSIIDQKVQAHWQIDD